MKKGIMRFILSLALGLTVVSVWAKSPASAQSVMVEPVSYSAAQLDHERYPYHSQRFSKYVNDSMRIGEMGDASDFYDWMETSVRASGMSLSSSGGTVEQMLKSRGQELAAMPDAKRADAEMITCAHVHRLIKTIIPRFSLDRGFEFYNTVKLGERQCYLQSVLIAGLLQSMGMDAGVAMVFSNERGQETNNGHAVTLVKLRNGHDLVVDASEPTPFAKHHGLFVKVPRYKYVMPVYEKESHQILSYRGAGGGKVYSTRQVRTLGNDFINSQFWYYRGERTPGSLILTPRTPSGLAASEERFRTSVAACPSNPLAVYMLGRVLLAEGKASEAKKYIDGAYSLYKTFGWIPAGATEYYLRMK